MAEIDRERFATISRLVGLFGNKVSSDAIRRYIKRYKEYFNVVYDGGVQHVEIEHALKVLSVIHGAIRPGQNRGGHDVLDALKAAGINPIPKAESNPNAVSSGVDVLVDVKKIVVELSDETKAWLEKALKGR